MQIALLFNKENFEKYSSWHRTGWGLVHMDSGKTAEDAVIATGADVLIVDTITKISSDIISRMPGLRFIHSQCVAFNAIERSERAKCIMNRM